jgi:hypothetical protein
MHEIPTDGFLTRHLRGSECECGPLITLTEEHDGQIGWVYKHHRLDGQRETTSK